MPTLALGPLTSLVTLSTTMSSTMSTIVPRLASSMPRSGWRLRRHCDLTRCVLFYPLTFSRPQEPSKGPQEHAQEPPRAPQRVSKGSWSDTESRVGNAARGQNKGKRTADCLPQNLLVSNEFCDRCFWNIFHWSIGWSTNRPTKNVWGLSGAR